MKMSASKGVYGCNTWMLAMQLQLGKLSVLRRDAISTPSKFGNPCRELLI
jgi:hypothetical protein